MKTNKLVFTILILFIMLPIIYADCTDEEIRHFKEIKNEYKITYEFNQDTKRYTLTYARPESSKYDYGVPFTKASNCEEIDDKTAECRNIKPALYKINIIGRTTSCTDVLETIELDLPQYNPYFKDPLCEGIEEFVLCQPTYDKEIDYETFASRVETYRKTKSKQQEVEMEEDETEYSQILEYIKKNLFTIIVIAVFLILLIITIILTTKSLKKSRRLE